MSMITGNHNTSDVSNDTAMETLTFINHNPLYITRRWFGHWCSKQHFVA